MDKSGLCLVNTYGRYRLLFNGDEIGSFRLKSNSLGVDVNGSTLKVHGVNFAGSLLQMPNVTEKDGSIYFGEVPLLLSGKCINITAEDYNSLIKGNAVAGYSIYSPSSIYNIVDDVATADEITYTVDNGIITFSTNFTSQVQDNLVYGNIDGALSHNTENFTNTLKGSGNPFVSLKYFDQVIHAGEHIDLTYHVDTYDMDRLNYDTVGTTFTVEITTESGVTVKRTTYAGVFDISTPAFSTVGETWFSIRCIDSDGVSSATQYFDVLVKSQSTPNLYRMTDDDLKQFEYGGETYQIIPNINSVEVGMSNKFALSALFAKVKNDGGYDGILMYNDSSDNNGDGTIYWIDYHGTLGTQTFYECEFSHETNKFTSVTEVDESVVVSSGKRTYKMSYQFGTPAIGSEFGSASDVTGTTAYIVNNTSRWGNPIVVPDSFTVNLNECTFAATQCNDIIETGRIEPCVILFNGNTDSHITNGKVKGNYVGYDFAGASRRTGVDVPSEHIHVIGTRGAKFCSFTNLDISGSVGYDGNFEGGGYTIMNVAGSTTFQEGMLNPQTGEVDTSQTGMIVSSLMPIQQDALNLGEIALGKDGNKGYWAGEKTDYFMSFYDSSDNHIKTVKTKQYYLVKIPPLAAKVRVSGFGTTSQWGTDYYSNPWVMGMVMTKCIKVIDCYWHDSRSAVINGGDCVSKLYKNCTFQNVAKETGKYAVTPCLGDFEDSRQWTCFVCLINCEFISGPQNDIVFSYCQHLTFDNNKGIEITNQGGIQDGFIINSMIPYFIMGRNWRCPMPHVLYDNDIIDFLLTDHPNYPAQLALPLAMSNVRIVSKSFYSYLKLKNSTNGYDEYD